MSLHEKNLVYALRFGLITFGEYLEAWVRCAPPVVSKCEVKS